MHNEGGGRGGWLFEESVKFLFPSWTRYRVWGVEGNAGVEIVKDFVDLLDLIVNRSCASEAGEGY